MYAVIFEVEPEPERRQDYLEIAAQLRPELEQIDGFISVERFQSLTRSCATTVWRRRRRRRASSEVIPS
jgi:heme-degrading monooxygenase HmoA